MSRLLLLACPPGLSDRGTPLVFGRDPSVAQSSMLSASALPLRADGNERGNARGAHAFGRLFAFGYLRFARSIQEDGEKGRLPMNLRLEKWRFARWKKPHGTAETVMSEEMRQSCMLPGPPLRLGHPLCTRRFIGPTGQPMVGLVLNRYYARGLWPPGLHHATVSLFLRDGIRA